MSTDSKVHSTPQYCSNHQCSQEMKSAYFPGGPIFSMKSSSLFHVAIQPVDYFVNPILRVTSIDRFHQEEFSIGFHPNLHALIVLVRRILSEVSSVRIRRTNT